MHACIATKMARRSGSALSSQRVRPCGPDDVARASLMWRYSTYGMSDPAAWGMDAVRRRVLHACGAIQLRLTAVRACRRAAARQPAGRPPCRRPRSTAARAGGLTVPCQVLAADTAPARSLNAGTVSAVSIAAVSRPSPFAKLAGQPHDRLCWSNCV